VYYCVLLNFSPFLYRTVTVRPTRRWHELSWVGHVVLTREWSTLLNALIFLFSDCRCGLMDK